MIGAQCQMRMLLLLTMRTRAGLAKGRSIISCGEPPQPDFPASSLRKLFAGGLWQRRSDTVIFSPPPASAQLRQCKEVISDRSGFVNRKIMFSQRRAVLVMRFERAERRDQDAGGRLLTDPAPAPALLERPLLKRAPPPYDMP
jgi:hypothetical protein